MKKAKKHYSPQGQNIKKLLAILGKLASVASNQQMELILKGIVNEIAELLNAEGCSIYLEPELNPFFQTELLRGKLTIDYEDIQEDIIVLAATSREENEGNVGRAFYRSGEGITGWVYKHGTTLNIRDVDDEKELKSISPDLQWEDLYGGVSSYYKKRARKPLLLVALRAHERMLGVMKFYAKQLDGTFTPLDETIAVLISQILSTIIVHTSELSLQSRTILDLVGINAQQELTEILISTSRIAGSFLDAERCRIYLFNSDENSTISMVAENGRAPQTQAVYERGKDLVGWVYNTGKPLLIEDIRRFQDLQFLTDEDLHKISDGNLIDEDNRALECRELCNTLPLNDPITFMAVPIEQDDDILGVISAYSRYSEHNRRKLPFSRSELNLLQSFATMVTRAIEIDLEQKKLELLISLGYSSNPKELFELVISEVPRLVSSAGCSIFELKKGVHGPYLQLVRTSRKGLAQKKDLVPLTYRIGEGKTGYCGLTGSTLVVNHFGAGEAAEARTDAEKDRITVWHKSDLHDRLLDEQGYQVGIIQLRCDKDADNIDQNLFRQLCKKQIVDTRGLPSVLLGPYYPEKVKPSWSFAAIPIKSDPNNFWGVMTVGRPTPKTPFSSNDITVMESIASHLAAVMGTLKNRERNEELFMSLAHELNTPITGILAESQNLMDELVDNPALLQLARNNLEQVQRLHLLTETIMGVMTDEAPEREFSFYDIGKVLSEARSMFEAEAAEKGCDIHEPGAVDGPFPEIEMCQFDLLLAVKNIVHNAVKYSFRSSQAHEEKRYVKIWGGFVGRDKKIYKFSIQNYGVGIAQDEIDNKLIFQRSYRGLRANDRRRTGAGFGLAHARSMIEDIHGGYIEVSSIPQGGEAHLTTFTVYLPIRQADKSAVSAFKEGNRRK